MHAQTLANVRFLFGEVAPDPKWGESVVAVIVRKPGFRASEEEFSNSENTARR